MSGQVTNTPENVAALVTAAWQLQRQGQPAKAEAIYRAVLTQHPETAQAWHNLGLLAVAAGKNAAAIELLGRAVQYDATQPRYHTNLAQTLRSAGRFEEALAATHQALLIDPDFANATLCRAQCYLALLQYEEAAIDFAVAIARGFKSADILQQYGQCLSATRQHAASLDVFNEAVALQPGLPDALNHRSIALFQLRHYAEALADCDAAIRLRDDVPSYWNNRGNVQVALGRFDAALLDYDRAIALKPDYPDPYVNKGIALLHQGNFAHGWFYFEWRWQRDGGKKRRAFQQPLWLGKTDVQGKTIFLHSEQGLGDTLQFFRYATTLRQRGAKVFMGVQQPLKSLIQHALPDITVYAEGEVIPPFDLQCPLMSLPLACGTQDLTEIPPSPVLAAPEKLRKAWAKRLGRKSRRRIGLVWQGNPEHLNDHNRSMKLEELAPLGGLKLDLVCLQKAISAEDRATLDAWGVAQFADDLGDFSDTAALIAGLDLVIAVDTSVVHLAGAMGKPVWLLQPANPDFRWLLGRDDSPWYPSMRIFWQDRQGGWPELVARVVAALAQFKGVRGG